MGKEKHAQIKKNGQEAQLRSLVKQAFVIIGIEIGRAHV